MRRYARTAITALLCLIPASARSEEEKKGLRPYATLDIFLPANAGDGLWNDIQTGMSQLQGAGYSSAGTINTKAAVGFRLGVVGEASEIFDLGASAGYIAGPNSDASLTATRGAQSGIVSDKREIRFFRFLLEPTLKARMSENTAFHLSAGLGLASGRVQETFTCTGNACVVNNSTTKNSASWTGFAWEISPYFYLNRALLGLRYAGFPSFKGNSTNSKIEWSSFGFFAGYRF